ncbi:MAG: cupin domain-containing protein [Negativicutes bacterium]|nr:cupin domain-containing protein [Negativicutes bacterium]
MIVKPKEATLVVKQSVKGGKGAIAMRQLMEEQDFAGTGRLFNVMTLKPGDSVGHHTHEGDWEAYYILAGQGYYLDNGKECRVEAGDFALCRDGDSHYVLNDSNEDLVLLAIVIYSVKK